MLRIAILAAAVISGGAAAWLSTGSTISADAASLPQAPMKPVLVAATDLVPGTRIDATALEWRPWPVDALSERYVLQEATPDAPDTFAGMAVRGPIAMGEPVYADKLASRDAGLLAVMLSEGKRAVAVKIGADTTAGGLILPNDRVDVIHTRLRQGADGQAEASSRAILRKVRVLAIDQTVDSETGSVVGKTATLELNPGEAETVVAAEAAGAITLVLRSASEPDEPEETAEPEEPKPALEPVEEQVVQALPARTVRVFRGLQQDVVELNR